MSFQSSRSCFLGVALFGLAPVYAQGAPSTPETTLEEIVVDGVRLRSKADSRWVVTEKALERESGRSLGALLRETAGVDFIAGSNGSGTVSIRGSSGTQVLVLIDGVKVNDPSAPGRGFDWSRIDVRNIEHVEVLRGPQAVAYGSDAIGGVVLIRTKRGRIGTQALLETGSYGFARARVSGGGVLARSGVRETRLQTYASGKAYFVGQSSALAPPGATAKPEKDEFHEVNAGGELQTIWSSQASTLLGADLRASREDIDAAAFDDDPNSQARNRELRATLRHEWRLDDQVEIRWLASHLDFRRAFSDQPDSVHTAADDSIFRGKNSRLETSARGGQVYRWLAGLEATRESIGMDSLLSPTRLERSFDAAGAAFGEFRAPLGPMGLDLGSRYSRFRSYGGEWSGKTAVNLPLKTMKFFAALSTGFKAPSLYNLYAPQFGNPNLQPEEAVQTELGVVLAAIPRTEISLRIFENHVRNRIGFETTYVNIARAEIRGVEFEIAKKVGAAFRFASHHTVVSSDDLATGRALSNLPRRKSGFKIFYDSRDGKSATISGISKSPRVGRRFDGTEDRLPSFFRLDLSGRYPLGDSFTLSARIENLLDRRYQEIRGYSTPGLSAYVGLELDAL